MALSGASPPLRKPRPKARSRTAGAAVPLDAADKLLLNLLQSSFPLEREPFEAIARQAELSVDEVEARTQRLLDERSAVLETLTAIRRAGADLVFTYYAKEATAWL